MIGVGSTIINHRRTLQGYNYPFPFAENYTTLVLPIQGTPFIQRAINLVSRRDVRSINLSLYRRLDFYGVDFGLRISSYALQLPRKECKKNLNCSRCGFARTKCVIPCQLLRLPICQKILYVCLYKDILTEYTLTNLYAEIVG